ncbi:MAG: nucleoside-diphosphate kinase [Propionibacteriaceae bacterium]|jgi:nucleoside-diphosphate kinase|nr:nucleoside-diphosphate kinase [Propionibacteriaceae bacterium]
MSIETTLVLVKPDAVARGLIGEVIRRFERRGLAVLAIKGFVFTDELLREHYAHLADRPFFPRLAEYMKSDLTVALAIAGVDAVQVVRTMVGETNSRTAQPGTIRGDLAVSVQRNAVHASDSPESALLEVARFFPDGLSVSPDTARVCDNYATDEL